MALIETRQYQPDYQNPYMQFSPEFLENEVIELDCQIQDFEHIGDIEHADQARGWRIMAGLAIEQQRGRL